MNDTNPNLETPRTLLRKYSVADRSIFTELFTDNEVNFYMGGPHCENPVLEIFNPVTIYCFKNLQIQ